MIRRITSDKLLSGMNLVYNRKAQSHDALKQERTDQHVGNGGPPWSSASDQYGCYRGKAHHHRTIVQLDEAEGLCIYQDTYCSQDGRKEWYPPDASGLH